jgi:hypothetical protein
MTTLAIAALLAAACGDGEEAEPTATPEATATDVPPTAAPSPTTVVSDHGEDIAFLAGDGGAITVDGDSSDWDAIEGASVTLEQIEIPPGVDWDEPGPLDPIDVVLKVATDADNIYMLLEVPDDYDFDPDDHNMSASVAVMFLIDPEAGAHMGAGDDDLELSLGMVDIWHWELDCGAGVMSGGGDPGNGDDPDCNLDDEFATEPEEREDDGEGDVANAAAENSLAGVWEHSARSAGAGADGVWIFEMSRPLQTGDPQDAQFQSGGTALIALAYFDADESLEGWTDTGHLQSAEVGWIVVTLP